MAESLPSATPATQSISTTPTPEDPFLNIPPKDLSNPHSLSRPLSNSSRRSEESRRDVKKGDDGMTGVIIIGLDSNDAATVGTTTVSRGSSSVMDPRRPSETNDTEHDDNEVTTNINSDNNKNNIDDKPPPSSRDSNSSSSAAAIPVMLVNHPGRSNSISTAS